MMLIHSWVLFVSYSRKSSGLAVQKLVPVIGNNVFNLKSQYLNWK